MSTKLHHVQERKAILLVVVFILVLAFPFLIAIYAFYFMPEDLSLAISCSFIFTIFFIAFIMYLCCLYDKPLVKNWVYHSWQDIELLAKQKGLHIHKKLDRCCWGDNEKVEIFKNNEKIFEFIAYTDINARMIALDFITNFKDSEKHEGALEAKEQPQETKIEDDTHTRLLGTTPPAQIIFDRWVYKGTRYSLLAEAEIEENFVFIKYGVLLEQKDKYKVFRACDRDDFIKELLHGNIRSLKDWEEKWRLWCVDNWRDFSTSLSLI